MVCICVCVSKARRSSISYTRQNLRQISTDGPDHNVLKIKPPLCFSKGDAEILARAIEQGLADFEEEEGRK